MLVHYSITMDLILFSNLVMLRKDKKNDHYCQLIIAKELQNHQNSQKCKSPDPIRIGKLTYSTFIEIHFYTVYINTGRQIIKCLFIYFWGD